MLRNTLSRYGFSLELRDDDGHLAEAREIERLGFGALWIRGGQLDSLDRLTEILGATRSALVAPAIIPPDRFTPEAVVRTFERAEAAAPDRLVVGLGRPHAAGALARLSAYVDALDGVPRDRRILAAFGPRMLGVARDRFAGALPALFTPEQVAWARHQLGPTATLAVGLYVVLDDVADRARATARQPLNFVTSMPSYRRSLARQGFSQEEIASISDRLIDDLVAWGGAADVVAHADRLLAAGADHVQLSVLSDGRQPAGVAAAGLLAAELGELTTPSRAAAPPATS